MIYKAAKINPGKIIPTIKSPIETSAIGPSTTTTTEGGIIVPKDPPAHIVPEIKE